jgi:alpha-tubulin suppressor-like RCC1 family protein
VCWGENNAGQLAGGKAPGIEHATPLTVLPPLDAVSLSAGGDTTCAVRQSGEVVCWGDDSLGQLGRGSLTQGAAQGTPQPVQGLPTTPAADPVVEVAVGTKHVCARTNGGKVFCWGDNEGGQLAPSAQVSSRTAAEVSLTARAGSQAGALAVSPLRSCAIQKDKTVACQGDDRFASTAAAGSKGLVPISGATTASRLSLGAYFGCEVQDTTGEVACWGRADEGQRGTTGATSTLSATLIPNLDSVEDLATGEAHACGIVSGQVFCWGSCGQGECGDEKPVGETSNVDKPLLVPGLVSVGAKRIFAGGHGSCALTNAGKVLCWGSVGGVTGTPTATPTEISAF